MEVVVEGHADAAVHLHAVLDELGAVVADVGLGRADQLGGVGAPAAATARAAASVMAWLASSHIFMSANRCLSSW